MDIADFPSQQLLVWIPVDVIRERHWHVVDQRQHTIQVTALPCRGPEIEPESSKRRSEKCMPSNSFIRCGRSVEGVLKGVEDDFKYVEGDFK